MRQKIPSFRKVYLNASEKLLVFVTIPHRKFHLYVQLSYTKISYLRKNTHLRKDAAFLHFRLKESSENMIFPWNRNIRKLTKIWSFLPFSQKISFYFMQCNYEWLTWKIWHVEYGLISFCTISSGILCFYYNYFI